MRKKTISVLLSMSLLTACTLPSKNTHESSNSEETKNTSGEKNFIVLEPYDYHGDLIIPFNTTVRLQTENEDDLNLIADTFEESMLLLSKQMDPYHSYKDEGFFNVYDINASYGTEEKINLNKDLFDLLKLGKELTILSKGKFNITIGNLYDKWSSLFSPFPIENDDPDSTEINNALGCTVNYKKIDDIIELDNSSQSVIFHSYDGCNSKVKINLGAIAKGYAAERVKNILSQYSVPFLINCGTSSIITYVPDNYDKTYYIGIRDPYARVYTLFDYKINESGILTSSGDDSNYFLKKTDDNTIIRHHILDAETGYPNNFIRSDTIFSTSNGAAMDALSTALFNVKSPEEKIKLVESFEKFLDTNIEWSYFVESDNNGGVLYATDSFYNHIEPSSFSEHIYKKEYIK